MNTAISAIATVSKTDGLPLKRGRKAPVAKSVHDQPTTACLKPMNKACHQLISSAPLEGTVVSLVKNEARL